MKKLRHAVVGELALDYEALELTADAGQTLITFTAAASSASHEAMQFLASWATASGAATMRELPAEEQRP